MNKKYFIFTVIALMLGTLLVGCGGTTVTDDIIKISKAIESGKPMQCVVSATVGEGMGMEATYWVKGEDIRMETEMNGVAQTIIQKGDMAYMAPQGFMATDCEWISIDTSEESEDAVDIDYEKYEEDPMYTIKCSLVSFGDEKFEVGGKVCNMEEMMGGMMDFPM